MRLLSFSSGLNCERRLLALVLWVFVLFRPEQHVACLYLVAVLRATFQFSALALNDLSRLDYYEYLLLLLLLLLI